MLITNITVSSTIDQSISRKIDAAYKQMLTNFQPYTAQ